MMVLVTVSLYTLLGTLPSDVALAVALQDNMLQCDAASLLQWAWELHLVLSSITCSSSLVATSTHCYTWGMLLCLAPSVLLLM